jgi:hypothetical protein
MVHSHTRLRWRRQRVPVVLLLAACSARRAPEATDSPPLRLAVAESLYADLRELRDRYEVTTAAGQAATPESIPLTELARRHDALLEGVRIQLNGIDSAALDDEDGRALGLMRSAVRQHLTAISGQGAGAASGESAPDCRYDPARLAVRPDQVEQLRARMYACYGWAQSHVVIGSDTLDRLTILGLLGRTNDARRRQALFRALEPVWRSINGDNEPGSPYRRLIGLEVGTRGGREPSSAAQARAAGVPPDSLEGWLLRILEAWREGAPDSLLEPWDWYHQVGTASRALASRVPAKRLTTLNAEVYRALGADVDSIGVRYDLAPRPGKTPVAFCTFGRRARLQHGSWSKGEPWVFATYRTGGIDNLNELLHETGHAVHIAAIRTRPAFADWPDSDPFTEALAEFVALDLYEPAWQIRWLGDSVSLADGLRARYGGIVMDVAWAVFELRMQRDPGADPNQVWTRLTQDYLRIRPYPELSWWAMRGQLVDSPGYMMNYAAGAILIAAIRARTQELHGPFVQGDPSWYGWVVPRLLRFGLERPTREVVERFLGGPVTPTALLGDMGRMRGVE